MDNVSQGGMYVGLDLATHRLSGPGRQYLSKGGSVYTAHPDTGVSFDGYALPCVEETLGVVRRAAELLPCALVGWDVALTQEGPVLLEGNERPDLSMSDVAAGGLKRNPVFKRLLDEMEAARA